ncbi:hypothetical protein L1887_24707 [Cichorium endivia]|nr:hypothetical protein L1887_24707 [Cichorium endivia]
MITTLFGSEDGDNVVDDEDLEGISKTWKDDVINMEGGEIPPKNVDKVQMGDPGVDDRVLRRLYHHCVVPNVDAETGSSPGIDDVVVPDNLSMDDESTTHLEKSPEILNDDSIKLGFDLTFCAIQ